MFFDKLLRADGCAGSHYPFLTQKERDNETNLDYFINRYYSSAQGRFTSPDQPFLDQEEGDPQSWNLYSYVRNNPLRFSDPTGQGRWEEIDGQLHWVGDVNGEYDNDLGATWVAVEKDNPLGGYWDFGGDQSPTLDQDAHIRQWLEKANERFSYEPPMGGGLRTVGSAARAGVPLLARAGSALVRWLGFGKKAVPAWKLIQVGRPLDKMGHAAKHLKEFQRIDPSLTADDVAKILEHVRQVAQPTSGSHGAKLYKAVVDIGGQSVKVQVVESAGKVIKSGYPVP